MCSTMIDHLRHNDLLSIKQFGFLKGRSTNIQMICVMDDWTKSLNEGIPIRHYILSIWIT